MDILLYPFGSKLISFCILLDPNGYHFGYKRIQKDIHVGYPRLREGHIRIHKDIQMDT